MLCILVVHRLRIHVEQTESLEQLRVLWHGFDIAVEVLDFAPPAGVDTAEDLQRVRRDFQAA